MAGTAPPTSGGDRRPGWQQVWVPAAVVTAAVVALGLFLAWPHLTGTTRSDSCRGHRWSVGLPDPTSATLELDDSGALTLFDTQQQVVGAYTITGSGRLVLRVTGVSAGSETGDQTVADALAPLKAGASATIRPDGASTCVLEVGGRTLTLSTQ